MSIPGPLVPLVPIWRRRVLLLALFTACALGDLGFHLFAHPFTLFFGFLVPSILVGTRTEALVGLTATLAFTDLLDILSGQDTPFLFAVGNLMILVACGVLIGVVDRYRDGVKRRTALMAHLLIEQARVQEEIRRSEQALDAQRELVLRANHRLRTPLTTVCGYTEMAIKALNRGEADKALERMRRVQAQCWVLTAMLEKILTEEPKATPQFRSASEALEGYAAQHTEDARIARLRHRPDAAGMDSQDAS